MQAQFRPCTAQDADISVPLIFSSGSAQFRFVFSVTHHDQALEFLRYSFLRGKGQFGFSNHTAVLFDGEQVGVGALWTSKSNVDFFIRSALQIFAFYGFWNGLKVALRGLRIETVIKPVRKNVSYLGQLAIHESMRGKGLGRQLISYFFEATKTLGLNQASLDVECENRRAKKLYEGMGFKDREENVSTLKNEFGYVLNHFRMEVDL